jgi:hypothetical protein
MDAMLSGPDTTPVVLGEVRLVAVSFEAAGTGVELVIFAEGLSVPLGFIGAAV